MARDQRDISLAIKKYVCEFIADVTGRSGNYDLHGFLASSHEKDVQALSRASGKGNLSQQKTQTHKGENQPDFA
jgi:hypothetical protein